MLILIPISHSGMSRYTLKTSKKKNSLKINGIWIRLTEFLNVWWREKVLDNSMHLSFFLPFCSSSHQNLYFIKTSKNFNILEIAHTYLIFFLEFQTSSSVEAVNAVAGVKGRDFWKMGWKVGRSTWNQTSTVNLI